MKPVLFLLFVTLLVCSSEIPRHLTKDAWTPLLNGRDLAGWHAENKKALGWFTADYARWDKVSSSSLLHSVPGRGSIMVNGPTGRTENIVTDQKFGDIELYLEFLIPKGSNSGVYLHGLYEVQIRDSYGIENPDRHECGAIYERWVNEKGVGGSPPLRNASRPPGEWQKFEIRFRAPRFDANGRKVENARFLHVLHNGVLVQQNVAVPGPTRSSMELDEAVKNPLMLQGNHGPVAYRNIYVRPLKEEREQ